MKIMILGAGPAGLFAAHAARKRGHDVLVMSKPRKSHMNGAQYLHRPIPDYSTSEPFEISYELLGTIDEYRAKVYGGRDMRGKSVSVESLVGKHQAWDIRDAYDNAWEEWGSEVLPIDIRQGGDDVDSLIKWAGADMVVSTIPATLLCRSPEHTFAAERVWSTDKAHFLTPLDWGNVVVCSGDKEHAWYRQSIIQGFANTEYPENRKPPMSGVWEVIKPLFSNCNCQPDVIRMGRYGLWEKGVLSDGAYYSMAENLDRIALHGIQDGLAL